MINPLESGVIFSILHNFLNSPFKAGLSSLMVKWGESECKQPIEF